MRKWIRSRSVLEQIFIFIISFIVIGKVVSACFDAIEPKRGDSSRNLYGDFEDFPKEKQIADKHIEKIMNSNFKNNDYFSKYGLDPQFTSINVTYDGKDPSPNYLLNSVTTYYIKFNEDGTHINYIRIYFTLDPEDPHDYSESFRSTLIELLSFEDFGVTDEDIEIFLSDVIQVSERPLTTLKTYSKRIGKDQKFLYKWCYLNYSGFNEIYAIKFGVEFYKYP